MSSIKGGKPADLGVPADALKTGTGLPEAEEGHPEGGERPSDSFPVDDDDDPDAGNGSAESWLRAPFLDSNMSSVLDRPLF